MSRIQSEKQAIEIVKDNKQKVLDREAAIYYLEKAATPDNLALLVDMLEDDAFGVRWAAAVVLAKVGDSSMAPLLHALIEKHDSTWLREGSHHVLHYSSSQNIREQSGELQKALRGPGAEMATMQEAFALLKKLSD